MNKPLVIVIAGPTAVGKTALALGLAQKLQTEIISADSRQCFREMNIGTAKPTPEEINSVQHYFINTHSVTEDVTAYDFEQYAMSVLAQLFSQKKAVIVCGGTGLYIHALCEGLDEMPKVDESISLTVEQTYKEKGLEWLQQELLKVDPKFYETAEQENPVRLMRALSFFRSTSHSINSFKTGQVKQRPFDVLKVALDMDRSVLYGRINRRVDLMMKQGLEEEAKSLLPFRKFKNLNTVGYSELFDFFDGKCTRDEAIDKIKQHSRNYAKRQLTWFRKDEQFYWFNPKEFDEVESLIRRTL